MADNKLNLVVQFSALDGLSGALKGMIGLGRDGTKVIGTLHKELKDMEGQLVDVERRLSSGSMQGGLLMAQRELRAGIEETTRALQRQKRFMAIDRRTATIRAQADRYKQEGQSGLMWGMAAAVPAYAMAREAGEYQAMVNQLRILGLGDRAVSDLTAYSKAMNVAGSSAKDNLRYLLEAQGAFRESGEHSVADQLRGAKTMAPLMAKMAATLQASGHAMDEEQERYFLRFVEQAGGTTDPRRASALTDGLFRALQSSGGTVDPAAYQAFLARAGTSGMRLSSRAMFADFEPLIAEMHDQAGVGLMGAYSRMNGMVKNQAAMRESIRLGLWDQSKIEFNSVGGVKQFKNGQNPLNAKAAALMASDPVEFYRKFVLPSYQANGVKDRQRENMMLFGNSGGKLFNLIDKQLPTILRSREAYQRTQGLDQAYNQTKNGFFGEQGQLRAAWKDFLVTAGSKGGLLEGLTSGLHVATGALRTLTDAANAHPTAFKWISIGLTSLLGMNLAISAGKLAFGNLLGPVAQLWGVWSKYRAAGSIALAFPRIARALNMVGGAAGLLRRGMSLAFGLMRGGAGIFARGLLRSFGLARGAAGLLGRGMVQAFGLVRGGAGIFARGLVRSFGLARSATMLLGRGMSWGFSLISRAGMLMAQGLFRAAMFMMANPMVAIITGIIVVVGLLAYAVYRNWGTIRKYFSAGWSWLVGKWNGVKGWFIGLAGQMGTIGTNIIQGLVKGITSAPQAVWNALKWVVMSGVTGVNKLLGIKSPSRLFMAMGGHITNGLAIGVDRNAHGPVRAVTRMAAAVAGAGALSLTPPAAAHSRIAAAKTLTLAPAASARRAHAAGGPAKIEIHIHQQPGEDAQALTRRVMVELRRAKRKDGRAEFTDSYF